MQSVEREKVGLGRFRESLHDRPMRVQISDAGTVWWKKWPSRLGVPVHTVKETRKCTSNAAHVNCGKWPAAVRKRASWYNTGLNG